MGVELQQVKQRMAGTRQIRQVTSAMQRVAAARLTHDRRSLERSDRYTTRLREVAGRAFAASPDTEHAMLRSASTRGPVRLVVLGADRGLCGGHNARQMEAVEAFVGRQSARPRLLAVGAIIGRRCRRLGLRVDPAWRQPRRAQRRELLDRITRTVVNEFVSGQVRAVHVLYTSFHTNLRQEPRVRQLLPIRWSATVRATAGEPEFEPAPRALLSLLLPELVRQELEFALLHSLASEHAARQDAMTRAADNAGELLRDLRLRYSRLRQESITTEMIELAGGGAKPGS